MIRGAGCGKSARPDLWGPREGNLPGLPDVTQYVDAPALNFRSTPRVEAGNRLGTLYLCQPLFEVAGTDVEGWLSCRAELDGVLTQGFVSSKYVRESVGENREKLVASVFREWMRFERGAGLEHVTPYSSFVGEMWRGIGLHHLDGTDRDVPWSAAAISFFVRNAGSPYAGFRFAASHSKYVHAAIRARQAEDRSYPFWGYRLHERRPKVGDIVCRDTPDIAPAVDYDVAAHLDAFRSHTDVVMQIESDRQRVLAIGGNVGHSVKIAEYGLAPGDFLDGTRSTFALLVNRTDGDG